MATEHNKKILKVILQGQIQLDQGNGNGNFPNSNRQFGYQALELNKVRDWLIFHFLKGKNKKQPSITSSKRPTKVPKHQLGVTYKWLAYFSPQQKEQENFYAQKRGIKRREEKYLKLIGKNMCLYTMQFFQ